MLNKYIVLINQLNQGYHLNKNELEDLGIYLKSHLKNIEARKKELI